MLKKIVISGILLLSSFFLKAQNQLPFHFPFPNSPTSYYNIGWMKSDSGVVIAVRDTSLRPRYAGTVVVWQHAGVDTSVWLWSGTRFFKMLRLGDVTGGGGITQLTGDIIAGPGSGVVNATLPNVNGNVGVFGTANSVGSFTANAKGQIVGASSIAIQISESQVTNLTTDLASKIGLSSLGASPPLSYNNTTGQFSIQVGNGSQNGYITSTDWNTFNGKLSTSLSSAFIFVGNGSNVATGVAMSGDATISNTGALTLTSVIVSGSCTNCNISFDGKGRITTATSGSGGGGSGTVTTVGVGNLSPLFTASTANATTTPFTSFTASTAPANSILSNLSGSTGAYGFNVPTITNLNTWAGATIAVSGANVSFANLTATGTVTLSGLLSGGISDSVLTWNSATHVVGVTNRILQLYGVQGISPAGSDSFQLGGSQSPFFKPDSIFENYQPFYFVNGLGKGTVTGTDSVNVTDIHGQQWHVPLSAIGGSQTLQQVFTQQNAAILTVSDTINTATNSVPLTFVGGIRFGGPNGTYSFGDLTHVANQFYTRNMSSDGSFAISAASTGTITLAFNGTAQAILGHAGQLQLNAYTSTSAFTGGTPTGLFSFDASGNLYPIALGTNLSFSGQTLNSSGAGGSVTVNGTTGSFTGATINFATTTNTANTALTIPASGSTLTFTLNPAVDFGDNSRSATTNIFYGFSMGNTTATGTDNVGIGNTGFQSTTTGSGNIGIGKNSLFAATTATAVIGIGGLAEAANATGVGSIGIGRQAGRNDDTSSNVFIGDQAGTGDFKGSPNIGIGRQALFTNTSGVNNVAIGDQVLKSNIGNYNTVGGSLAGTTCTSCTDMALWGFGAGSGYTSAADVTAVGSRALDFNLTGSGNTVVGFEAMQNDYTGFNNTVAGLAALTPSTGNKGMIVFGALGFSGSTPVSVGNEYRSGAYTISIGDSNEYNVNTPSLSNHNDSDIYVGNVISVGRTFTADTNRVGSTAIGNHIKVYANNLAYFGSNGQIVMLGDSGYATTSAINALPNIASGVVWNQQTATYYFNNGSVWGPIGGSGGSGVTTVGTFSGSSIANGASIATTTITFGPADATNPGMMTTGTQTLAGAKTFNAEMVIDGVAAGKGINAVSTNTAFGVLALRLATGGTNTGIGNDALANTVGGTANTAIGSTAMLTNSSGANNTAIGAGALNTNTTASNNVAIGSQALHTSQVQGNQVAIGFEALNAALTGANNLAIGYTGLLADTSGSNNLEIGNGSLTALLSGNANFVIGNQSGNTLTTGGGNLLIGYKIDVATASTSNTLDIGGVILGQGLSTAGGSGYLSGTIGIGAAATTSDMLTVGGLVSIGNVSGTFTWNPNNVLPGSFVSIQPGTLNDATTAASGTVANAYVTGITSPTLSATNTGVTYTNAYSFWINSQPVAGTNVTITNPYALGVIGNSLFNGTITSGAVNITGKADLTGQTGAVTVTTYAVPGSTTFNTFEIGGYITVTAVTVSPLIQLQVTWTDETSNSRTQSFFVQGTTTGISTTGAYPYSPIDIRVKKGTTITVSTTVGGTGTETYDVGASIIQLY